MNRFHKGQKGFTLIELLVVIAILGILSAVAVPLVIGFIEEGHEEAAATELTHIQLAVVSAMAHARVGATGQADDYAFGNTGLDGTHDDMAIMVGGSANRTVGSFIAGGYTTVSGHYTIAATGEVTQVWFPGYRYPP